MVSFSGARNQASIQVSDVNITAESRPYPAVVKATLNPGCDVGVRGNHYNYARRRSPSPSLIKMPAVNQPATKVVPTQRPSIRSPYHAGCSALSSQSRIPVYQRNRVVYGSLIS